MITIPKDFTECVKNGGKVRVKQLKNDRYIQICYDKGGKSHAGEVKINKKSGNEKAEKEQKQIEESKRLIQSLLELKKHFDNNYHN